MPLYRKYRPQAFAHLVGQAAISQGLGNAITLGQVAHAYLFTGPRGTGKTSTARIFAKSLNCELGPTVTPCQTCASCTGITQGHALDVIEFDAASHSGVGDARELIESAQTAPLAGRYKIFIIDEVHMLSNAAFNALLKTLEEPPERVVFLFATTEAHKVLPTIISRCQRFDFRRITTADLLERLQFVCAEENLHLEPEALSLIARHAKGGMRDALSLLDQVSVLAHTQTPKPLTRADILPFLGALEEETLVALVDTLVGGQVPPLLEQLQTLSHQGIEPARLVKNLLGHLRNQLVVSTCLQAPSANTDLTAIATLLDLPQPYVAQLAERKAQLGLDELPGWIELLAKLETDMRRGGEPQLLLEVGLMQLACRETIISLQSLQQRIEALEKQLEKQLQSGRLPSPPASAQAQSQPQLQSYSQPSGPAMPAPKAALAPAAMPAPVQPVAQPVAVAQPTAIQPAANQPNGQNLPALYQQILDALASPPTRAAASQQAHLVSIDNKQVVIGCASASIHTTLQNPTKLFHLQKAIDLVLGPGYKLSLVHGQPASPVAQSAPALAPPEPASEPASPLASQLLQSAVPQAPPAPSVSSAPLPVEEATEEEAPPLEPDYSDEGPLAEAPVLSAPASSATSRPAAPTEDWEESQQQGLKILQGQLL